MQLDNRRVPTDGARPKFSAIPRSFVRVRTKKDAVGRSAIHVHLLTVSKRKLPAVAYAKAPEP